MIQNQKSSYQISIVVQFYRNHLIINSWKRTCCSKIPNIQPKMCTRLHLRRESVFWGGKLHRSLKVQATLRAGTLGWRSCVKSSKEELPRLNFYSSHLKEKKNQDQNLEINSWISLEKSTCRSAEVLWVLWGLLKRIFQLKHISLRLLCGGFAISSSAQWWHKLLTESMWAVAVEPCRNCLTKTLIALFFIFLKRLFSSNKSALTLNW